MLLSSIRHNAYSSQKKKDRNETEKLKNYEEKL